jgi:hypothetical protein
VGRAACILCLALIGAAAAADRSRAARAEFVRTNPCPATGKTLGPCPGHEVDHVRALCAGGTDHASNMAWLTVAEHKRKTRDDVGACRAQRAGVLHR